MNVVFCQVEVSVSGRSLVQRSHTECGASECDREAWIMRRPWPTGGLLCHGKTKYGLILQRLMNSYAQKN